MQKKIDSSHDDRTVAADRGQSTGTEKAPWQEPKLKFVEPKLVERGTVKDLTGGFFGPFSP